ncbi:MAG: indolepyruvate oxidoreductase subunit beta [Eubacteriales bacterium]|nr:indolepyruvate oxidoreductase subunit beta [Eubacteriales bacterium]MDD3882823.1 indolepyruvate oxidoreductase subunit beta [Eubacteriales bacterium]MDD4513279.1 indolepyruvate oxidoreductase subunit beta [Eubacteriales bacterium]
MTINCLLCGVGGQGTVLASRVIAEAAMQKGEKARTAETIGMAQRGGCVVSHVRIGECFSPLVPPASADLIIAFEPGEAVRCLAYLKDGGAVIACTTPVVPVMASIGKADYDEKKYVRILQEKVGNLVLVSAKDVSSACGSAKALNVYLLGAAIGSGKLPLTEGDIEKVLEKRVKPEFINMNRLALKAGIKAATEA